MIKTAGRGVHPWGRRRPGRSTHPQDIGKLCNAVWVSLTSLRCVKRLVVEAFSGSVSQYR